MSTFFPSQACGLPYERFRTGLTYPEVYAMLWSGQPDSTTWRFKGRSGVLGYWHQLKQTMWDQYERECQAPELDTEEDDQGDLWGFPF